MATNNPTNNADSGTEDAKKIDTAADERREMRERKDQLAYDFQEMLSSADALLRSTAKYTGAEVEEARTRLQQQLDLAKERSGDMTESIRDAGQRFATRTDECVHKHPWTCIGVAFIAGMVMAHCNKGR